MRGNARAGAGRGEDDVFGDYYRKHRLQDPPGMRRARAGGRLEEAQQEARLRRRVRADGDFSVSSPSVLGRVPFCTEMILFPI